MSENKNGSIDILRPDLPSRCTWHADVDPTTSPHVHQPSASRPNVLSNILCAIGETPLVKLNKIPQSMNIKCEMLAKCEYLNPGGSVKDRIGVRMIEESERAGELHPGDVLIEPTSGNTGIGLAMAAAVKGYRCVIVMPEKTSKEKTDLLRCLGAEIVRTPTAAAFDSPEGLFAVSQRLNKTIPNSHILGQYHNAGNPLAHYDTTAEEILRQTEGRLDMVVAGAGTGGTITGLGRKIKERYPQCKVIGVDPEGSVLAQPESLNTSNSHVYEVEGIGYDFIPTVLDRDVVDAWEKTNDKEAMLMARRLIREEGLLCGGSSGAIMVAALRVAADLTENQRCVVMLPDGVRNYMTKLGSDQWMVDRGFLPEQPIKANWWWTHKVSDLKLKVPLAVLPSVTCEQAFEILKMENFNQVPVVDECGTLQGLITSEGLMTNLVERKVDAADTVGKILSRQFQKVTLDCELGHVAKTLENEHCVVVVCITGGDKETQQEKVVGLITPVDLLSFVTAATHQCPVKH